MASRLIKIVNTYMHYKLVEQTGSAIWRTASDIGCSSANVAEAVFPYVSPDQRREILAMRSLLPEAKFIYTCRVRHGVPASQMPRYARRRSVA